MLLIGVNNTDERHFENVHSAEEVYAGTKAIVDYIKERYRTTKILVLRIFPRRHVSRSVAVRGNSPSNLQMVNRCSGLM